MSDRRPIAEFFQLEEPHPDVIVGDEHGRQAQAAIDPDSGRWVDLTDPAAPIDLSFKPTWFRVNPLDR